jgi:hypothetical protein
VNSGRFEWSAVLEEDVESILTQRSLSRKSDGLEAIGILSNKFLSLVSIIRPKVLPNRCAFELIFHVCEPERHLLSDMISYIEMKNQDPFRLPDLGEQ